MATSITSFDDIPVIRDLSEFDRQSGNWLERIIFNHRLFILLGVLAASLFLGWHASKLVVNASFDRLIPQSHPYIKNYFAHKDQLGSLGNAIRIVVEDRKGNILDREYLEFLAKVNDKAYLIRGVDRPWVKSIWMAGVRWQEATEKGYESGPVMMQGFTGTAEQLEQVRINIIRAGLVGSLVANDFGSSMIVLPLLDKYAETGERLNYGELGRTLENDIRSMQTERFRIHIIGFGKLMGDLINGLDKVMGFFAFSAVVATLFVFLYTRCVRSTVLLVGASALGVLWLLGLMQIIGFELDPYSILVPFLIFAIGLSHGAQKMNGVMQDIGRGTHKYIAARFTFRRLFLTGLVALVTNIVGFAVLLVIDIPVIKDMALTASLGVTVLIFTKLVFIPVALSYIGVSKRAAMRGLIEEAEEASGKSLVARLWDLFVVFTRRGPALTAVVLSAIVGVGCYLVSLRVQVGDLDAGAPELRADSTYNKDVAYIGEHFGLSSDQFVVMVRGASIRDEKYKDRSPTDPDISCDRDKYPLVYTADQLEWMLANVPGVQAVNSGATMARYTNAGMNEGNPKWMFHARSNRGLHSAIRMLLDYQPEAITPDCSLIAVTAYLSDHKAATLNRVLTSVEQFAAENNDAEKEIRVLPAAGSAGIESLTNIVVHKAQRQILFLVYGSVIVLCFVTFRNWRASLVALIPLLITSMICEALMVWLDIGIKVATLPVIALGVGVGVDYALYILSIQLALQRRGATLAEAYRRSLLTTGKIVGLIGLTMAAGVVTWAWSPIKFQADMGILLTFMFLWNMIGALVLIPALSRFLLRDGTMGGRKAAVA